PGIPAEEARDRLIEERLQMQAAKAMGITLTEEQIAAGQDEFAGRANMDRRTFIQALGQAGIGEETFRDFVIAGLLWREVIRQKFLGQVNVTEADVDRELSEAQPSAAGLRLLYSEIILPGDTPESRAQAQELAAQLSKITSIEAFSAAARDYSAAPSAGNGGQVDWVAARDMQPGLVQMLIS